MRRRSIVIGGVVVVGAGVVLLVALLAGRAATKGSALTDGGSSTVQKTGSFRKDQGDPVNVEPFGVGKNLCLSMSGDPYLTSNFCFAPAQANASGVYTVMFPVKGKAPTLVVGVLPHGARRALVTFRGPSAAIGGSTALGTSHGSVFLAKLPPLDPEQDVTVEFK